MATPVYAWPPIAALSAEWDREAPLRASYSALTGRRYASADQPVRRIARVTASARSNSLNGAGYMLILKRLIDGGANLIRLNSYPLHHFRRGSDLVTLTEAVPMNWTAGGVTLNWITGATSIGWQSLSSPQAVPATSGGFPALSATGLPASAQIARAGDYVVVYASVTDTVGQRAQVMAPARSNAAGAATIRIIDPITISGRLELGARDTGVFRVVGDLPRAEQPIRGDWSYSWEFAEVFDYEVGGFAEITDWWQQT